MYGDLDGVSALLPSIGEYSSTSTPTEAQVYTWLDEASALINGALAGAGYSITVAGDALILPVLSGMTQLYAAANVLQARGLDSTSGGDENKSELMFRRFYAQLKLFGGGNLDLLGVTVLASVASANSRRMRTRQTRRIDGYSATYEGSATAYEYPSE